MTNKTYRISEDGVITPICQNCMKGSAFEAKEYPDNLGCMCCNPKISKIARILYERRQKGVKI